MSAWEKFYTDLYSRDDMNDAPDMDLGSANLLDYLPLVLGELAGFPAELPPRRVSPRPFIEAANDAIEENRRAYERAIERRKYAEYVSRQYNPFEAR